jgi:glyoxylase-like metal-dependent hydrolase (beta-lactamase superfamily II)
MISGRQLMCEHPSHIVTELGAASDGRRMSVAEMHELAPGIVRIPTSRKSRDNAFLVHGDDGLTLVDVGWAGAADVVLSALDALGHTTSDIKRIIVTHAHPDHVRGLAQIRRQCKARVLIHSADVAWLQLGRVPGGGRQSWLGTILDSVPVMHWEPVDPDGTVDDGETIGGLRVIHTPGHTPGHIALLHESTKTLLTGDAVLHRGPEPAQGPDGLSSDPFAARISLAKLPADVNAVGFAHGTPLAGGDVQQYQAWLNKNTPVAEPQPDPMPTSSDTESTGRTP